MHHISLTSDGQRSGGSVVTHSERDRSRVSRGDASEREAVCRTLAQDHVHFIILQRHVLEFPLSERRGGVPARNQTFKVNVVSLVHNAALQEPQDVNLDLCLTNTIQRNGHISVSRGALDRDLVQAERIGD